MATTLLILRATQQLIPSLGLQAATIASLPAGRLFDRFGPVGILIAGVFFFLVAYLGFAVSVPNIVILVASFIVAGLAIGYIETCEHAAVATLAPTNLRGSAFGLLATVQSFGNIGASAIAGVLWSAFSPTVAFVYLAIW